MTPKEVIKMRSQEDRRSDGYVNGGDGGVLEINNKRKLEEQDTSDVSLSPPSTSTLSSSPSVSSPSPSSSPTSSASVLASPIRRLKMTSTDWLSVMSSTAAFLFLLLRIFTTIVLCIYSLFLFFHLYCSEMELKRGLTALAHSFTSYSTCLFKQTAHADLIFAISIKCLYSKYTCKFSYLVPRTSMYVIIYFIFLLYGK